jgi:hypothetical protein
MRFRARVAADIAALLSMPAPPVGPEQVAARMESLPGPIRRYLRYAVTPGARAIRTAHLVWIDARDCLLSGCGNMLVKLNLIVKLADVSGPSTDQSAAVRWLTEVCWFPSGYAGDCIRLNDPRAGVTAEVDEQGRLLSLAGDRYHDTGGGEAALTPWIGICVEYRDFDGPSRAVVHRGQLAPGQR